MLRPSMRTGVPVFSLPVVMPWHEMDSEKCRLAGSEIRPPGIWLCPTCKSPLRKVPAVTMTAWAPKVTFQMVRTPTTVLFSTSSSSAWSCQRHRLSVFSSISRHLALKRIRSHWALGLHMAGPLERLSMRNWMAVSSVTTPIIPPRASISLTICPFAMPPTAGLQLIWAIFSISMVMRHVFAPIRAAAWAASHPACPAPTTSTSNWKSAFIFMC